MFALLIAPYVLILSLNINDWLVFLSIITGIGMAGVGMNVMHEEITNLSQTQMDQ